MNDEMTCARRVLLIALAVLCAGAASQAQTQTQSWPQRPVKLLVPFAAGGNIDVMGRLAAGRLSDALGQQFVVENRVGGNGAIATEAVARAPADGYTLLWASTSVLAIFPAITRVGYDPVKDFAPISLFGVAPQVLIVNPKFPAGNVAEFVAHVRSQKEKLAYAGGGGPGSASNLLMSLFLKRAGLQMTNVSYRGTAPALTDLIAGHIPTMFAPISEVLPQARAGHIRMLAVSSGTRSPEAPEVPSSPKPVFPDSTRCPGPAWWRPPACRVTSWSAWRPSSPARSTIRNSCSICERAASSPRRTRALQRSPPSSPRRSRFGARQ